MTVRGNPLPAKEHEYSFTPLPPPPPPILLPFLSPHLRFTIVSDHKKKKGTVLLPWWQLTWMKKSAVLCLTKTCVWGGLYCNVRLIDSIFAISDIPQDSSLSSQPLALFSPAYFIDTGLSFIK